MEGRGLSSRLRIGLWVFAILMIMAIGEYFLGIALDSGNLAYMIFMNIVDAALIVWFFMHVHQLWHPEE